MAEPTPADLLAAIEAMRNEMRNSFVVERTDREGQIARYRTDMMSRMEGMEDRLTALLRDLSVNWHHVDRVDQKVDNLRDETRLENRTVVEMMNLVRALEGRVAKLEQGRA